MEELVYLHVQFLPSVCSLQMPQKTVNRDGQETELRARGRHDPCVVPRGKYYSSRQQLKMEVRSQKFF